MDNPLKSRTFNTARNIKWGYILSTVQLLLSFISRTIFIYVLGKVYLGVNGLFSNILGVLSLSELGFGTAITFALYKPLAENDTEKIKSLMRLFRNINRVVAVVVAVLGIAIAPFIKYLVKTEQPIDYLVIYYLTFLFNTSTSYLFSYKEALLNANQQGYVVTKNNLICVVTMMICQCTVLLLFKGNIFAYTAYLVTQSTIYFTMRCVLYRKADKLHPYLRDKEVKKLDKNDIKSITNRVKALFLGRLGDVAVNQTDSLIISSLIGIAVYGLVDTYVMLTSKILSFVNVLRSSMFGSLGNLIATEGKERQANVLGALNFMNFWVYGFVCIAFAVLTQPFITLWIGTGYLIDNFSLMLILLNLYLSGQHGGLLSFRDAGGAFESDWATPLIQGGVNLAISIVLALKIGLPGVYIGSVVSTIIAFTLRIRLVYRKMLGRTMREYLGKFALYFLMVLIVGGGLYALSVFVILKEITAVRFAVMTLITGLVPNLIFFLLFRRTEEFEFYLEKLKMLKYSRQLLKDGKKEGNENDGR
ncbi:MAG TPA: polysaccharide biosynthesis protein [Oscillospiraceae bacterium]|nr:polysaccharide biosynthesis protein [Oscillospiraceae bacterium]HPF56051.1 polysaccharide biosynthesis protein [Clostridiales bacterium]HPK36380.1 polysaccharide biosynthesis protein [Oscillospiraceae bacterium]HPR75756.1 polysaccharide biosynthesis protein [Oscillospiraceae bacterium]